MFAAEECPFIRSAVCFLEIFQYKKSRRVTWRDAIYRNTEINECVLFISYHDTCDFTRYNFYFLVRFDIDSRRFFHDYILSSEGLYVITW